MKAKQENIAITAYPAFPRNVVAINYDNLQLVSLISIESDYKKCSWKINNNVSESFYATSTCRENVEYIIYKTMCEKLPSLVTFNFTLLSPLQNNVFFQIQCKGGKQDNTKSIFISVQSKTFCHCILKPYRSISNEKYSCNFLYCWLNFADSYIETNLNYKLKLTSLSGKSVHAMTQFSSWTKFDF